MSSMSSTGWLSSSQEAVISAEMWGKKADWEEDGEYVLKWRKNLLVIYKCTSVHQIGAWIWSHVDK